MMELINGILLHPVDTAISVILGFGVWFLKDLKGTIKELTATMTALHITIAKDYVTRQEFDQAVVQVWDANRETNKRIDRVQERTGGK